MSGAVCAELLASLLDAVPQLVRDNAEVGTFHHVPLLPWEWPLHFRSLSWLALGPGPSPDQPSKIPLIHEEAPDGGNPPGAAAVASARGWSAGLVELRDDGRDWAALRIPLEDATHDGRFGGVDFHAMAQ